VNRSTEAELGAFVETKNVQQGMQVPRSTL
jgi:hypothetical protein